MTQALAVTPGLFSKGKRPPEGKDQHRNRSTEETISEWTRKYLVALRLWRNQIPRNKARGGGSTIRN